MRHARRLAPARTVAAALAAAALACSSTQRASAERKLADVLIPPEQEQQLGLQVKQQLEQQEHVQYVEDPQVNGYVQEVAGKILAQAKKDRPDVSWTVKVINDPKTVNAFATPGGYLYVYSGLLLAADDTAEVAGVLGHESGHVVARHSARQMVDAFGLEGLAALALGKNPGGVAQLAAGLAGKTSMLAFSRGDEAEADTYGVRYAAAAGYDPHGIARFFEKLARTEGKQPGWAAFLSDHPLTPDRIQKVNAYIAEHHLEGGGGTGGADLAAVKKRLAAIPAPPPKPQEQPGAQPAPGGGPGQAPAPQPQGTGTGGR
jgi:predicted Zn-dependent protease